MEDGIIEEKLSKNKIIVPFHKSLHYGIEKHRVNFVGAVKSKILVNKKLNFYYPELQSIFKMGKVYNIRQQCDFYYSAFHR